MDNEICQYLENVCYSVSQYVSNDQCLVLEKDTSKGIGFNVRVQNVHDNSFRFHIARTFKKLPLLEFKKRIPIII